MQRAVDAGARCATHVGNGIPNAIDRHHNPLWWQLACDDLMCTFITDGHHLPADFIKTALRTKGVERFVAVSDASPLAALPPGEYQYLGKRMQIELTGRIFCPESGGLGGSHSTMLECMNHLASLGLLSEDELWQVGYSNPLSLLGTAPCAANGITPPSLTFGSCGFAFL